MMNTEKCINIINELNADALFLCDEANMHYICGFSPSEGMILVFKSKEAYHLVDSRYTEIAEEKSKNTGLNVIEISQGFYVHIAELIEKHNAKTIVFENETISLSRYKALCEAVPTAEFIELGDLLMRERN